MNETTDIKPVNSEKAISTEIQTIYKDSLLGKIPEEWKVNELGEIVYLISGLHLGPEEYNKDGNGVPYFTGPTDYTNSLDQISKWTAQKSAYAIKGDILLTVKGSGVGSLHQLQLDKVSIGRQIMAVRVKNTNSPAFIYNCLCQKDYHFQELAKGNMIPGLTRSDILKTHIIIPPSLEQHAIGTCLSTIDETITKTNQLIAQKELRKKWLMQQLLTGKKRLKGFCGEWKEVRMDDIFNRVTRKNEEVNTNVVTISAQRGFVRQTDFFNKSIASEILDNYFLVEKGEFCYNKSYSNGYPWGATKRLNDFEKAVVTTLYICFGIRNEKETSGDFFEQFFEANLLDKGLTKIAHEGGRAHGLLNVTPNDFFSLKITIPEFEEQTAIAQVLQVADKEILMLKAKAEKLKEEKKGMMQVLLTGKKRLKIQ